MLSNSPLVNFPFSDVKPAAERKKNTGSFARFYPGNSQLARYATHGGKARGRLVAERECPSRSLFARDRDRILHATAFRRLNYKTQVFIYHEGDHFRSRLTHSLEVAQIARTLARMLNVDEDLCEAISLAHDIGHTPFGHAGERALQEAFQGFGGFDHNIQTLRVLTRLEKRYIGFDGLNLCWETLEGLIKHNGPVVDSAGRIPSGCQSSDIPDILRKYELIYGFGLHLQAGPEAQIAAIADDIAYNNHDIDDGLRAGLFGIDDLQDVPLVWEIVKAIRAENRGVDDRRLVFELNRRLITLMINDVFCETTTRIETLQPQCSDDIREAGRAVVSFSGGFAEGLEKLQTFLFERVYRNERVMRIMRDAEQMTRNLAEHYLNHPSDLPDRWRCNAGAADINKCARHIRDFIAGMTDRYIIDLHRSLFDATPKLR